jgi:hypothetical protein
MCKITPKCSGFADLCVFLNLSIRGDERHSKNGILDLFLNVGFFVEQNRKEEAAAIEEMEIATKQLRSAYMAIINTFARIAKNPNITVNSTEVELDELNRARERFDKSRAHMDKIADEIRAGLRK